MRTPTAILDDTLRRLAGDPVLEALERSWRALRPAAIGDSEEADSEPTAALRGLPLAEHFLIAVSLGVAVPAHLPALSDELREARSAGPPLDGARLASQRLLADFVEAAAIAESSDPQLRFARAARGG
jgi:hypothetical protein